MVTIVMVTGDCRHAGVSVWMHTRVAGYPVGKKRVNDAL